MPNVDCLEKGHMVEEKFHNSISTMDNDFHEVPDLKSIVQSTTSDTALLKPGVSFLKKMNAQHLVTAKGKCSIFDYVQKSRKRKRGAEFIDAHENKSSAQDWSCDNCNTELVYVRKDAQRVCPQCGKCTFFQELTRADMISQGYTPTTTYLYQRHNHFKTWLKRTQGKETTFISLEITDLVRDELKKEGITDMSTVDTSRSSPSLRN